MTTNPYDAIHRTWERTHARVSPVFQVRWALVWRLLPPGDTPRDVLDAGCGTGEYSLELLRRGHRVTAFDGSEYGIRRVHDKLRPEWRERFSGRVVDFDTFRADKRFDCILCTEVLEHLDDDAGALRRLAAALAPDGRMVLTVPANPRLFSAEDRASQHRRRYTRAALLDVIARAGLEPEVFWCYGFPVLRAYHPLKSWLRERRDGRQDGAAGAGAAPATGSPRAATALLRGLVNAATALDRRWLGTDLGVGYVVRCRHVAHGNLKAARAAADNAVS